MTCGCRRRPALTAALVTLAVGLLPGCGPAAAGDPAVGPLDWPALTATHRPWTRWWWQGSAVDDAGLTAALEAYRDAGLGGVEITPIYGVAGAEDRFVDFLSPAWMDRLEHTLAEAERLGLGVDMATGTGWPFGGPAVRADDGARYVAYDTFRVSAGERLDRPVTRRQEALFRAIGDRTGPGAGPASTGTAPSLDRLREPIAATPDLQALALEQVRFPKPMPLEALVAYSDAGDVRILTDRVDGRGALDWTAPPGDWTLYAVFGGWHGKLVERAAPGGEGWVLDHFSARAVDRYLSGFDDALRGRDLGRLRGFFNDSYEVDDAAGEADWTTGFLEAFQARRGYDLRRHLPALFGGADDREAGSRVLVDYRRTVSDLLLEHFTARWDGWAARQGALTRNQAHGSPGNLLDLYAATDIPETEGSQILRFKFATSAANVAGRPLASAEAATWLDEHFRSSLADVKRAVDGYFLGGVNHVVYHGTAYSPLDEPWPGWLFYAAVHFQPTNPQWAHFPALNRYVARTQSILQGGRPDNDVLLYLPVMDRYARRDPSLLVHFDGIEPFEGMAVADDAARLQERGYAFDFVSDRQLQQARVQAGRVVTAPATGDPPRAAGSARPGARGEPREAGAGVGYAVVVVPHARRVPLRTLEALADLADAGATIAFHGSLPEDVPGLDDLESRRAALDRLTQRLSPGPSDGPSDAAGVRRARVGSGTVLLGDDLDALLAAASVPRETLVDAGLGVVRRRRAGGTDWLIVNPGDRVVDGWVPLADRPGTPPVAAALFDPMSGRTGVAELRRRGSSPAEARLRLEPGQSVVIRGYDTPIEGPAFPYFRPGGPPRPLAGTWRITFRDGGPSLPPPFETDRLTSWTERGDTAATRAFSGLATYTLRFPRPEGAPARWRLDLGDVRESARVRMNGHDLGVLIGPGYHVDIDPALLRDTNTLEVDVASLMANRVAAMDRRGEGWKRFYNVNFPARLRENVGPDGLFDASGWPPLPSGLLGPVTLTPMERP